MTGEYVFLDLETTGLEAEHEDILEVGMLITDKYFNVLGEYSKVINYTFGYPTIISDFVIEMHTKNGLWDECRGSNHSLKWVELDALDYLNGLELSGIELAGSTISFDRSFLHRHMPRLEKWFHYRNIDASTLKVLFKKYDLPEPEKKAVGAHRALNDCYDTMHDLRYYLQYLGVLPSE